MQQYWPWIAFNLFVLGMLALDLGVFHRKSHAIKTKEALIWSAVWIGLSLSFNALIYFFWDDVFPGGGPEKYSNTEAALKFLTAYIIEKSLSVDNIFVFLLLFTYFSIPAAYQHRILFWGIIGALIMRAILIFAGVALIHRFHWMLYVFGAILIVSGIKMALSKDTKIEPEKNPVLLLFKRFFRVTPELKGDHFWTQIDGRRVATPMFVVLLLIETTDLIFALDSIPAVIAISQDPFLVYTSNIFAIMGLRSLYFALAGLMEMFHYLHYGLSAVLVFVGGKMLTEDILGKMPVQWSLGIICFLLVGSVIASRLLPVKEKDEVNLPTPTPGPSG